MQDEPKIARTATTAPRELTAAEMQRAGGGTKLPDVLVSSYQHSGSGGGTLPGPGGSGLSFLRIKQRA